MDELRKVTFGRKGDDEAFHPLADGELAVLDHAVRGYLEAGRLLVAGNKQPLGKYYEVLRHNLLCGDGAMSPEQFRFASAAITKTLIARGIQEFNILPSRTVILDPWRAGLAFADAAFHTGFSKFHHLGARRNEQTLGTEIYFEEVPDVLVREPRAWTVIVADPMLATGNTDVFAIRRLMDLGVPQEQIFNLSVIAAPEGVDHVLHAFPGVRILTGRLDERLNSRGYIEPGLGDYGDLFFDGSLWRWIDRWYESGILSRRATEALLARMLAT
jgi:uracil phosphoribosyltransferase